MTPLQKKILRYFLTAIIYAIAIGAFYVYWQNGLIPEIIKRAGIFAPIAFIFFGTLKFIFPIIPGEVLAILGVLLFGPVLGLFYTLAALTIGSFTAFLLARKYGQGFVETIVGQERFAKVHKLSGDKTLFTFFLIYLLPGTPDDIVTYAAGLTGVSLVSFMAICILGRLPSYILYVLAGVSLATLKLKLMFIWWGILLLVTGALYFTRNYLKAHK